MNLTACAVAKKVITVVIIQINKNCHIMLLNTSIYAMIETVEGRKTKDIIFSKKSDRVFICSVFMLPETNSRNRRIKAITLPGKGNGSINEITSPIQQRVNKRII